VRHGLERPRLEPGPPGSGPQANIMIGGRPYEASGSVVLVAFTEARVAATVTVVVQQALRRPLSSWPQRA
jgi:hypothetical protein